MAKNTIIETTFQFKVLFFVYVVILSIYGGFVYQNNAGQYDIKEFTETEIISKAGVVDVLVNQLNENKKSYSNNVWTTLATIVAAIGMVLGSGKFQSIIKADERSIPVIQSILVSLYAMHAHAYMLYQNGNSRLMHQLNQLVGSDIYYFQAYTIADIEVMFNLLFDTILFLLLAYVVGRIRNTE